MEKDSPLFLEGESQEAANDFKGTNLWSPVHEILQIPMSGDNQDSGKNTSEHIKVDKLDVIPLQIKGTQKKREFRAIKLK